MSVCQHCGADAVGVGGVCAVCGWRASARSSMNESDPQATRADDPAATRADGSSRAPGGLRAGGSGLFAYAPRSNGPANTPGRISAATPAPASTRYCGACGARIEPGQTFCGQCGTPVSASGVFSSGMTSVSSDSGHYIVGGYPEWDPEDRDAPTVVDAPIRGGYRAPSTGDASGRALRIIVGVLCLLGSLISAIAAIVLAIISFAK
jgi:zinc-ribbon domain